MASQRRWLHRLCTLAFLSCGIPSSALLAEGNTPPPKTIMKKKTKPQPRRPLPPPPAPSSSQWGIGVGLFNIYPPQPTIEGAWRQDQYVVSAEAGVITLKGSQFAASSTYFGVAGRYLFTPSFFAGMGIGKRHITVMTKADMVVNNTAFPIAWTRTTDQTVLTPKIGWESFADRSTSLVLSLGVLIPTGTKFKTTRDVESIPGLPAEEMAEEERKKANDVKKVTSSTSPYLELKYGWFF